MLWVSAIVSTAIDNIPFVATMIPLLKTMEPSMGGREAMMPVWWALSLGSCFGGNGSLYEITIRKLNEFDNFDDCMIYIAEHFAWNPNSDGAKLMLELLERKFEEQ